MDGVDKNDRHVGDFSTRIRGTQWWKVFLYFGLDVARSNMFQICLEEPTLRAKILSEKRATIGRQAEFTEELGYASIENGIQKKGTFSLPRRLNFSQGTSVSEPISHALVEEDRRCPCNSCYKIASSQQGAYKVPSAVARSVAFTVTTNMRCTKCQVFLCFSCSLQRNSNIDRCC
jgi:hypothetical protein